MLQLTIPRRESWNEQTNEFVYSEEHTIALEHSLVSISKWESKWCKPFFSKTKDKTSEETLDYVRCMTITQNVKPEVYLNLSEKNLNDVLAYIEAPMTATWFSNDDNKSDSSIITSELIYYWMIAYGIPFECQKWHLNHLMALIRVCQIKKQKEKKMSPTEIMQHNAKLNEERRRKYNSKG